MIKLNVSGHGELCGGYSYSGTASFDGTTVKEVLEEIREFGKEAQYIGEGFGNPNHDGGCWEIRINGKILASGWINHTPNYDYKDDNKRVKEIHVDGGWYCFYDFNIITEDE